MKKRLCVLVLVLATSACVDPASREAAVIPGTDTIVAVADSIAAELLRAPVAGVALAVARNGEVVYRKAYGMADVAANRPLTLEDPHQIGSLTKQFTAAAVLQLVEQGRIGLDDPIQKYLPGFETQGHTVTIHHLLNHTSGIRSYTSIYGMNPVPLETVLDTIQKYPYDFAPGERFLYNNSGYYLLGPVLEAVTGVPYAQYLEEQIFAPLGMESTSYCGYAGEAIPVGYQPSEQGLTPSILSDMTFPGAAGGLCSTVDDLLVWQRALVSGAVINEESYARMTTPATLTSGDPMNYGYGLSRGELEGHTVIAHGGGIPGYNTHLSWYPEDSIGIVVLVNTSPGQPTRAEQAIARAALGLPRLVIADLPLSPEERAGYVGRYTLGEGQLRIFQRDGVLMVQPMDQPAVRLKYQGERTFRLDLPQEVRVVFEMDGDTATGLALHQGTTVRNGTKVAQSP